MACFCSYKERSSFLYRLKNDPQVEVEDYSVSAPYRGPLDAHPMMQKDGDIVTVSDNPRRRWVVQVKRVGYSLVPIL